MLCSSDGLFKVDPYLIARRLKDCFGDAKIIIVIRNQLEILKSMYVEYVHEGFVYSFSDFIKAGFWYYHTHFLPSLFYYENIQTYQNIFGKENVMVILFEDFVDNSSNVVSKICSFLNIPDTKFNFNTMRRRPSRLYIFLFRLMCRFKRVGFGKPQLTIIHGSVLGEWWVRRENNFGKKSSRQFKWRIITWNILSRIDKFLKLPKAKIKYKKKWEVKLKELYRGSNRKLSEEMSLNLEKYNYPL